jgi:hypothetical protein
MTKAQTFKYGHYFNLGHTSAIVRISARVAIPQVKSLEELWARARSPGNLSVLTICTYVLIYKLPKMDIVFGSRLCGTWSARWRKKIIFIFLSKSFKHLSHTMI